VNNANIDKDKAAEIENDMEWKAKMFHDFDGKTLDLKTFGIMVKLDKLKNHCWLVVANLILDRIKALMSPELYKRYLRPDFHPKCLDKNKNIYSMYMYFIFKKQ